jgi:hypothetical protein
VARRRSAARSAARMRSSSLTRRLSSSRPTNGPRCPFVSAERPPPALSSPPRVGAPARRTAPRGSPSLTCASKRIQADRKLGLVRVHSAPAAFITASRTGVLRCGGMTGAWDSSLLLVALAATARTRHPHVVSARVTRRVPRDLSWQVAQTIAKTERSVSFVSSRL